MVRRAMTGVALLGAASIAFSAMLVGCTFGPDSAATTTTTSTTTTTTTTTIPPTTTSTSTTTTSTTTIPPTTTTTTTTTTTIPPTTTSTSTTTTSTTTIPPTTTTTTLPVITEGAVVIVANASNVNGAAQQLSGELAARGFHMGDPTNAAGNEERLAVSKVYFMPAGADVAASIGRVMGDIAVARMPVPVSITGGPAKLGDATVVVMLGTDLASKKTMLPA